ncbi:MAG: OmpH family outer membrane protein [Armatimonadota bacterium]|jgi:Skp family chaperone for outer membrane proteins
MPKLHRITGILVLTLMFAAIAVSSAHAADNKAAFGTIDIEKVFNNCDKTKQLSQELAAYRDQLSLKLDTRKINRLLTNEEFNQLADLQTKQNPSAADRARVQELLDMSRLREIELQGLQQKPNLTESDKARLNELQDQITKTQSIMQADAAKYQAELEKKNVDMQKEVLDSIAQATASVAKEKGLSMVFSKSLGQIQFIVYSSADITDDVIKNLNKK